MAIQTTSTNLSVITFEELSDNVERNFIAHMNLVQPVARQLFRVDPIGTGNGDTHTYNEYDTDTFSSQMPEGVDAVKARFALGYEKSAKVVRYGKEVNVTEYMRKFNKVRRVQDDLLALMNYIPQGEELDLTHRFTFATSTSYTDRDGNTIDVSLGSGNALVGATQALSGTSTTYRNRISGDPLFSQGAYEAGLDLGVSDVLSNLGERRVMDFDVIFSTDDTATCMDIKRLLKSTGDVDGAHSGIINPHMGEKRHVVLPYLATTATGARDATKRKWWGLVATGQWHGYFGLAEAPYMTKPFQDPHNDNWVFGVRGSYLICVPGGRGVIMSCPTSA